MTTPSFFYSVKDVKELKELIRTGKPLIQIAREEHERFGTTFSGLYSKLCNLSKVTRKVRDWDGPKRVRKSNVETPVTVSVEEPKKGIVVPEGTTFEGVPKKVELFKDHFRVYF